MNVLVTGGAGYIGSHTVRRLVERGHRVTVLDTLERGHRSAVGDVPLIVGDAGDQAVVESALADNAIEAVVHFAAYKSVEESVAQPGRYFRNNVGGTLTVLEAARRAGVRQLIYSSSCAVYGTPDQLPVTEEAPLQPENPYGESKLLSERMLPWYAEHGIRHVVLRYFNAAGAWPDGSLGEDPWGARNLIPIVLGAAALRGGRAVRIFGTDYPTPDGTAIRDYVHVLDLADAHLAALDHLAAGGRSVTLNVGTGRGASVHEVVEAARRITGSRIETEAAPRRAGDPAAIWADPGLAGTLLGWQAKFGLDDIIETAWRWHVAHPDGHRTVAGAGQLVGSDGGREGASRGA